MSVWDDPHAAEAWAATPDRSNEESGPRVEVPDGVHRMELAGITSRDVTFMDRESGDERTVTVVTLRFISVGKGAVVEKEAWLRNADSLAFLKGDLFTLGFRLPTLAALQALIEDSAGNWHEGEGAVVVKVSTVKDKTGVARRRVYIQSREAPVVRAHDFASVTAPNEPTDNREPPDGWTGGGSPAQAVTPSPAPAPAPVSDSPYRRYGERPSKSPGGGGFK